MNSVLGPRGLLFWDCKCYRSPMMEGHGVRGCWAAQWGWQAGRGAHGPGGPRWALQAGDRLQWPFTEASLAWFFGVGVGGMGEFSCHLKLHSGRSCPVPNGVDLVVPWMGTGWRGLQTLLHLMGETTLSLRNSLMGRHSVVFGK